MKVAYHFTIPQPPAPERDAAVQEALLLRERFPGPLTFLYPARRFKPWIPIASCGLHHRDRLRQLDRQVDVHHLFGHRAGPFPLLSRLQRPLVFTLTAGLRTGSRPLLPPIPANARVVTTPSPSVRDRLRAWGVDEVLLASSPLDLERFTPQPPPSVPPFTLLAGSAPWSRKQFRTKGLDLLLRAAEMRQDLKLILLWRGVLRQQLQRRLEGRSLADRVEILDRQVDVAEVLERVHAAVVLAARPHLVKPFPHSLLEALAAGRPILVSRTLDMAEMVESAGSGVVVERLEIGALLKALEQLRADYDGYQRRAEAADLSGFSRERFLTRWQQIYTRVLGSEEIPGIDGEG